MKLLNAVGTVAVFSLALSGCGGGGGGGGNASPPTPTIVPVGPGAPPASGVPTATPIPTAVPTATPAPTATPVPSVSGDMLALAPGRGWNYQSASAGITVSTYVNVDQVSGQYVFVATGVTGLVPTVLTNHANAEANVGGALAILSTSAGYQVTAEVSYGSSATVPGSPLLVGSTLTQGTTTTPYPGATEYVAAVGSVPGASACPVPATGAQVQYTVQGQIYTVSYVPGCGITQLVLPSGTTLTLISVGSYGSIGDLDNARRVASLTVVDTARSLLGLERNDFPAARLFK